MAGDLPTRCRDALRRLHEQGRIASPWMAGMRIIDQPVRVHQVWPDGQLHAIHETDRPLHLWEAYAKRICTGLAPDDCPDPHDPATLGCLVALVREASGEELAYAWPSKRGPWTVYAASGHHPRVIGPECPTEPEAIVAALEALVDQ